MEQTERTALKWKGLGMFGSVYDVNSVEWTRWVAFSQNAVSVRF